MENRLIIFSILIGAAVLAKLFFRPAYTVAKPLPVAFIILLAFLRPERVDSMWLMAISFGLAGDLFLLKEGGFIPGLTSFLLGHIFYILLFSKGSEGFYYTPALVLGVGAVSCGVFYYLSRHLVQSRQKKYILPVLVYTAVSAVLIINALAYPVVSVAVLGAIAFGLSDFLLAFNKFVRPSSYVEVGVSVTYYAAQWLLALHFHGI